MIWARLFASRYAGSSIQKVLVLWVCCGGGSRETFYFPADPSTLTF